jgi:hypothetical protein
MQCIEVDFDDDLERVNAVMGGAAFDTRELSGRP